MKPEQAYEMLISLSRQETVMASCNDLLEWDEEVVIRPVGRLASAPHEAPGRTDGTARGNYSRSGD